MSVHKSDDIVLCAKNDREIYQELITAAEIGACHCLPWVYLNLAIAADFAGRCGGTSEDILRAALELCEQCDDEWLKEQLGEE